MSFSAENRKNKIRLNANRILYSAIEIEIYKLGTGKDSSVLDVVKTFEKASGVKIPYEMKPRRAGDVPVNYCDATKAEKELGWKAKRDLFDMCEDSWRWQKSNPYGY